MNKFVVSMAALATTVISAQAEYLSINAGYHLDDKVDITKSYWDEANLSNDVTYSAALGTNTGMFRQELELLYADRDVGEVDGFSVSGDLQSIGLLGNVYYAPKMGSFEPYLGVGAGVSQYKIKVDAIDASELVTTYKAQVGLAYHITESIAVDANYAYVDGKDVNFGKGSFDQKQRMARIGIRYTF